MIAALILLLGTPTASDFADQAEGLWTSAEQSVSEDYDFVASETLRVLDDDEDGVWIYQQNWILGEEAPRRARSIVRNRHEVRPYFQVVIQLRDFGDGEVHTTTYRLKNAARGDAAAFAKGDLASFDPAWVGEAACMGKINAISNGHWSGGASCPNGYKGGVKVESQSVRTPQTYVNWDRGFNAAGEHIWGPAEGGYIFNRWETAQ
ncbi:MAG: hypothetical protein HRU11_11175 [Parvularculaceae bacterium]|nr:hypothetical protein [Parvularculaceae bacterium]